MAGRPWLGERCSTAPEDQSLTATLPPQEKTRVAPGEKPEVVKTHLRNMIIVPEMIGSQVGVYNGKVFNTVEIKVRDLPNRPLLIYYIYTQVYHHGNIHISVTTTMLSTSKLSKEENKSLTFVFSVALQPEMTGHYLGEFSITYKPVSHGRAGIGATKSSRFVPLK